MIRAEPGEGAIFDRAGRQKVHGTVGCRDLRSLQIGSKSSNCTVLIRHGRNIGSTWGQLRPARPQLRPNLAPKWRNLAPKRRNLAPSSTYLGATSAQVEDHIMASKWGVGPSRPASFLSVLFSGCGRFSLRSDSNMVHMGAPSCTQPNFVGNNNETR